MKLEKRESGKLRCERAFAASMRFAVAGESGAEAAALQTLRADWKGWVLFDMSGGGGKALVFKTSKLRNKANSEMRKALGFIDVKQRFWPKKTKPKKP